MKVLLDHNIPHELRTLFPDDHEVYTTQYLGWSDCEDDELLTRAVDADFSVLVTLDRNLLHQQEVQAFDIGIIIFAIHPTTPSHLKSQFSRLIEALPEAVRGKKAVVLN